MATPTNSTDPRAMSPVVGTALLLGIVVILGTLIGLAANIDLPNEEPQAMITANEKFTEQSNSLIITHEHGDTLDPANVFLMPEGTAPGDKSSISLADLTNTENLEAGDRVLVEDADVPFKLWEQPVVIAWSGESTSQTFSTHPAPSTPPGSPPSPTPAPQPTRTPTATPTPTPTPTATPTPTPTPGNAKGISFAAFCSASTGGDPSDVRITNVGRNSEGEPIQITWESDVVVSTTVLKAGQRISNHAGGRSGTASSGAGSDAAPGQTPPRPCPSGESLIVKVESI